MTIEQSKVRCFMVKARQAVFNKPIQNPLEIRILRANLILEEALECVKALGLEVEINKKGELVSFLSDKNNTSTNLIELADGLADLHYVAYCGTANAFGIDMEPIFKEVHYSNMSKFTDGYRRADGKWMKGPSYFPANIKPILDYQSI